MTDDSKTDEKSSDAQDQKTLEDNAPKKEKRRKLTLQKRLFFFIVLYLILFAAAEGALHIWRYYNHREPKAVDGDVDDCGAIVFLCMGDSMTFGLGAATQAESYPMRLGNYWTKQHRDIPYKVYNLGIPGTNTSEGIRAMKYYLQANPKITPDFAFILYGVNNRWNLHQATIWDWEETVKSEHALEYWKSNLQITKLVSIISENQRDLVRRLAKAPGSKYRAMLDEQGWSMFFKSFEDKLLAKWIRTDLLTIAGELESRGVRPIILTYHYDRFGHLNNLIRQTALDAKIPIIELEQGQNFFASNKMFAADYFHLNAKGYNYLAKRVMKAFNKLFSEDALKEILQAKSEKEKCDGLKQRTPQ